MFTVNDCASAYFTLCNLSKSHMPNQHFTELGVPVKGQPDLNTLSIIFLEPSSLCKSIFEDVSLEAGQVVEQ